MADEKTYTKADLDAAIAEANKGLEAKRDELLAEVRELKQSLRKTQEIKPEDFAALESENDKLKGELAKATKDLTAAQKAAEQATKALEAESGFTSKLLIQDGIKSALIANGVKDEDYLDALVTKFSAGAAVVTEGDARVAKMGDKAVADAIKEWAGSDAGKKFVAAAVNNGGGAPGGAGGGAAKTVTRAQFDGMDQAARASFAKDGGKVVDAAA